MTPRSSSKISMIFVSGPRFPRTISALRTICTSRRFVQLVMRNSFLSSPDPRKISTVTAAQLLSKRQLSTMRRGWDCSTPSRGCSSPSSLPQAVISIAISPKHTYYSGDFYPKSLTALGTGEHSLFSDTYEVDHLSKKQGIAPGNECGRPPVIVLPTALVTGASAIATGGRDRQQRMRDRNLPTSTRLKFDVFVGTFAHRRNQGFCCAENVGTSMPADLGTRRLPGVN
jgi:hypothetical protein